MSPRASAAAIVPAGTVLTTPMSVTAPAGRPERRSPEAIRSRTAARFEASVAGVAFTGRGRVVPGAPGDKRIRRAWAGHRPRGGEALSEARLCETPRGPLARAPASIGGGGG